MPEHSFEGSPHCLKFLGGYCDLALNIVVKYAIRSAGFTYGLLDKLLW
jgi:hypothetical protein